MGSHIRLYSLACVDRRVIDRLARTVSENDRCLVPRASVSPCDSPMRTIDMDSTQLNALVVVVVVARYLRTTRPCKSGCWRLIKSHQARMLIVCGSPRHGYLGFIYVRPRGSKARGGITRSTKLLPGIEVG